MDADMKYSMSVILCALLSAIVWNIITWKFGLPSSSSHALIGGLIGSGICAFGFISIQWGILLTKVIIMLLLTPFIGFAAGLAIMNASKRILNKFNSKFNNVLI